MAQHQYYVHFCPNYNFCYSRISYYGRQTPNGLPWSPLPGIHALVQSLPLECVRDLWVASNWWSAAKVMDATSMIRLQETETSVFLHSFIGLHVFIKHTHMHMCAHCHTGELRSQGIGGSPNQQPLGTEIPSPATHKELNFANNLVSLEVKPSAVEPSDEAPAMACALTVACKRPWSRGPTWALPRFLAPRNYGIISMFEAIKFCIYSSR